MTNTPVILYIEDNKDNLKLVCRVLEASGFVVHGVSNGDSGLAFVANQIPDLILLDINLPELDGYAIAAQLRLRPELSDIPIVALTASVMPQDREKSFASGCTGFIEKPVDVDTLPEQITYHLNAFHKDQV